MKHLIEEKKIEILGNSFNYSRAQIETIIELN